MMVLGIFNSIMFSEDQIQEMANEYKAVQAKHDELFVQYISYPYKTERGQEFAQHGFSRRLKCLKRCMENVFTLLPPENTIPADRSNIDDATISLHAFVINVFGCIDNLAWVFVYETELKDKNNNAAHAVFATKVWNG